MGEDDFKVNKFDSEIKEYNGPGGEVVIPDGIRKIGYCAFMQCSTVISITLPQSIRSIDDRAFEDCTSLETVVFPERSLRTIGRDAFSGCTSLSSISSIEGIKVGSGAFWNCPLNESRSPNIDAGDKL